MPSDGDLTDELIGQFDEARRALAAPPHPEGLKLLLNSFGAGSGFGVYQLVADAVRMHPEDVVVTGLQDALQSAHDGVRSWASEIACEHLDHRLIPAVLENLRSGDLDTRIFSAQFVAESGGLSAEVQARVREALGMEGDPEVRRYLTDALRPAQA